MVPIPSCFLALFLVIASLGASADAQKLPASVTMNGFSFVMDKANASAPTGDEVFFTTYDGESDLPVGLASGDISEEVEPVARGSTEYRTDYIAAEGNETFEYGSFQGEISTRDRDADMLPDALETDCPGDFRMTGDTSPDFNAFGVFETSSVSIEFHRSAGSRTGSYRGSFSNSTQSATLSGDFVLSGARGQVFYERAASVLRWELLTSESVQVVGESAVVRNGTQSITIPSFVLRDPVSGERTETRRVTLQRDGDTYRGLLELEDGDPDTFWRDYTDFLLEIDDPNDLDDNSIPDLSFVPEPRATLMQMVALATLYLLSGGSHGAAVARRVPTFSIAPSAANRWAPRFADVPGPPGFP